MSEVSVVYGWYMSEVSVVYGWYMSEVSVYRLQICAPTLRRIVVAVTLSHYFFVL